MKHLMRIALLVLAGVAAGIWISRWIDRHRPDPPPSRSISQHTGPSIEQVRLLSALVTSQVQVADVQITAIHGRTGSAEAVLIVKGEHRLSSRLHHDGLEYAATGLAGAWLLNQFAGFRLVVIYVASMPSAEAQQDMGFREEERGENVWLVVPNDAGVFDGAKERDGIRCAHPVQVYLDLKKHPERSAEAAESLRQTLFSKVSHV